MRRIQVARIPARRFSFPKGAGFHKTTKVFLLVQRSECRYDQEGSAVVEIFFRLLSGHDELILETDTVLEWSRIPNPADNKRQWEKVRELVRNDNRPVDDAYLEVSLNSLLRHWKFSVDFDESGTALFYIERKGVSVTTAQAARMSDTIPFLFDNSPE